MAIAVVAKVKKSGKKFKYAIIQKPREEFPKHLLGETVEEAEALFKEHSKTLNYLARSYSAGSGLERTDLFGEAIMGLAKANRDFDPERSKNFNTFVIYKVKDALNSYVRGFAAPVRVPAYIKKVNRWIDNLEAILKCAMLDPDEVEAVLVGDRTALLPALLHNDHLRLSKMIADEAERLNISQSDLIRRARVTPHGCGEITECYYDEGDEEQLYAKIVVKELKSHMTDTEVTIADMIMEGRTYKEIAAVFNHKAPWVSYQLKKMRKKLGGTRP